MKNELTFNIPFSGFCGTTFINCFASTYMYLENITGDDEYECRKNDGLPCDGCGNCANTTKNVQEKIFFLFDTMSGHSSQRCSFDGEPTEMQTLISGADFYEGGTDYTIDFLFGFAGYEYRKLTDSAEFKGAVISSVDAGKPVIAKVKSGDCRFRVITGYDGESLLGPDYAGAQNPPDRAPDYDELDELYIAGEKSAPRYTLKDGLERIVRVMEYNAREKLWDGYIEKMGLYTDDSFQAASIDERKARMKRLEETMWHTMNCYNFSEAFRQSWHGELQNPEFAELWRQIGGPGGNWYGYTHDLSAALIALAAQADWSHFYAVFYGEMIELTLERIKKNDEEVLEIIKQALEILDQK